MKFFRLNEAYEICVEINKKQSDEINRLSSISVMNE